MTPPPHTVGSRWRFRADGGVRFDRMLGATCVVVEAPPAAYNPPGVVWVRFDDPRLANRNTESGGCWHTSPNDLTPDPT